MTTSTSPNNGSSESDASAATQVRSVEHDSVAATVAVVGDRWTVLILREAYRGARRFTEFVDRTGIAKNLLSNRLVRLVEHGLLERVQYCERPVRHEYCPTSKGWALSPALIALMHWGDTYYAPDGPDTVLVCRHCNDPVSIEVRCGRCDCALRPHEIRSA